MMYEKRKRITSVKYTGQNLGIIKLYARYYNFAGEYDLFLKQMLFEQKSGDEYYYINKITTDQNYSASECFGENYNDGKGIMYLFFNVSTENSCKVLLHTYGTKNTKIFCNNKFISMIPACTYDNDEEIGNTFVKVTLKKGVNRFVFEVPNPQPHTRTEIRISDYDYMLGNMYHCITQIGDQSNIDSITCVYKNSMCESDCFEFQALRNNDIFEENPICTIYNERFEKIDKFELPFGKKASIRLSELNDKIGLSKFVMIGVSAVRNNKTIAGVSFPVIFETVNDFSERVQNLIEQYNCKKTCDKLISKSLDEKMNSVKMARSFKCRQGQYMDLYDLVISFPQVFDVIPLNSKITAYDKLEMLCSGKKIRGQNVVVKFKSRLDYTTEQYFLRLPEKYSEQKKYPLILNCSTWRYSWENLTANSFLEADDFIFADVSVKGGSAGNYMGEALFFEIFEHIKKHYSIDEDRVFISGSSNGGYSAWSIAEKYPHIFAGAYPLAGFPVLQEIENLSNLPVIALVSDDDGEFRKQAINPHGKIADLIKHMRNIKYIELNATTHTQLLKYTVNKKVLQFFKKQKRDLYPRNVVYCTSKNRYRKAYWLTLHSITYGCSEANVNATIMNDDTICIMLNNSDGITIDIPPYINKKHIKVVVNNQQFIFTDYASDKIHIVYDGDKFVYSDSYSDDAYGCSKKGVGLLDVYYNGVTIIVPDNAKEYVLNSAKKFSSPNSFVNDGIIYSEYPIVERSVLEEFLQQTNYIIFEDITEEQLSETDVKAQLPITLFKDGFEYKGKKYLGEYSIMQIIQNPFCSESEILHIAYNSEKAFNRNYFLRKVMLGLDINGVNPYWGNEALICHNGKFLRIYEYGNDITSIK